MNTRASRHEIFNAALSACLAFLMVFSTIPTEALAEIASESSASAVTQQVTQDDGGEAQTDAASGQEETSRVIFDGNGATSGSMDDMDITADTPVQLPGNEYAREGYEFKGWSTTASGEDEQDMTAVLVPEDTTLMNWTFAWDANDDGSISDDEHFSLDAALRDGSLTLYAQWEAVPAETEDESTDDSQSSSEVTQEEGTQQQEVSADNAEETDGSTDGETDATDDTSDDTVEDTTDDATTDAATTIDALQNDNDEADVRDADNGGADNLSVTVRDTSLDLGFRLMSLLRAPGASVSAESTDVTAGDGSSIDSLNVFWLTDDTTDNDDDSLLYLYPSDNNKQTVTAQIDFSMSGEQNYAAGDIRLKIPAHIFKTRDGDWYGNLVLPLAESPSTKTDFNWSYIDDGDGGYYILTNTREMSAATQVSIQLAYENVVPSEVVDRATTADLSASIELTTHAGNTLTRTADPITAQIDTHETVASANKRYSTYTTMTADEMTANGWTIPDGMTSADGKYVVVTWYTYAYHEGNTSYTMEYVDSPSDDYQHFVVSNGSGTEHESGWVSDGTTAYEFVKVAYPRSQFVAGTTYTLTNEATWTCTETDDQSQTTATASASMNFVYNAPEEVYPQGHFYHEKWGDDNDSAITSHNDSYSYPRYGTSGGTGWYGSYPNALNRLKRDESVETSYEQYMRGFMLPWTMQDGITNETADGPEDFGARNVTMTITDGSLTYADTYGAAGSELVAGEDFTFSSLHLIRPTIYKAVAYDGSDLDSNKQVYYDNGQLVWTGGGSAAYGGTYGVGYIVDDDYTHIPQFTVTAYNAEGNAISTQKVDWTGGAETQDIALPDGTNHYEVSVTFGEADENGDYVAAIADAFVVPKITLNPTEKVLAVVQSAFDNQTNPVTYLTNADSMTATYEDGTGIFSMDATGGDRLRGYSEDVSVIPSKSVETEIDNGNQVANLSYTAKVEERSNITSADVWQTAVAEGDIAADTSCTWYDLLPKGVVPDLSSITLRDGDTITDAYTVPNYKGSGRTLLVVKANLTPTPVSYDVGGSIDYYEDVPTITFDATYSFESMRFYGNDIHNVIAYESGNETLGNVENYSGEPDNPAAETHNNTVTGSDSTFPDTEEGELEKSVMTDLDPNADNPNFVYAGVASTASGLSATTAELAKKVMVNNDGQWGSGVADTDSSGDKTAYIGGTYSYRLQATAAGKTQLSDIILYDAIELHTPTSDKADYGDTQWRGQLLSVDVSDMRAAGIDAKVYYYVGDGIDDSTDIALEGDDSQRSSVAESLTPENGWVTTMPADTSEVKAIAVDASKNLDGTDFVLEPGETTAAYVTMLAPRGDEALQYVAPSEGGTDTDTDGSHAYNNGFLWATTTDSESGQSTATKLIRMDYTKVGLGLYNVSATKEWDDNNDQDGVRPDSVTVHLYRDGVDTGESLVLDGTADTEPTGTAYESASWVATFKGLPYCDTQGNVYNYSIVEDVPEGYTQSVKYDSDGSKTLVNSHTPETVSVSGSKTWVDDTADVRPGSITVTLYRDGESYKTLQVTADEQGNWSYSFDDLPRYHDQGVEYTYTVGESVDDYITAIDSSTDATSGDVTAAITNTYHPYGDLAISKTVTGATEQCEGKQFSFTIRLTGADGGDFADQVSYVVTDTSDGTQVSTGTFTNGQTLQIEADQTLTLKDIPKGVTYTVIESAEAGYTASSDTLSGTIASNNTSKSDFTNAYDTEGSVNLSATKVLTGTNLKDNQFRFELRDEGEVDADGNVVSAATDGLLRTSTNSADGAVTFGALHYDTADNGHTFTYKISETDGGADGYTYSTAVYYAQVTPVDNGDGTMTCTVKYFSDADCTTEIQSSALSFANSYEAESATSLTAYKKLSAGTLVDGQFTFQLYDAEGNELYLDEDGQATTTETDTPLTATNDVSGIVVFPKISYTQDDLADTDDDGTVTGYSDKTFTYTAREVIPDDAVAVNSDYDMVDSSGTVVTSSDSALTYADATDAQKELYSFAKDGFVYSEESRSWNVTVSDDGDGTLSTTVENVTVGDDGTTTSTDDLPVFTNTAMPGSFSVQKLVSGTNPDPNQEFTYTIKITYPDGQETPDELDYTLSSADDTSTGSSVTASSLAAAESDDAATSSSDTAGEEGETTGAYALVSSIGSGLSTAGSALVSLFIPTPAYAQTPAGTGTAYAVLDSSGNLTFIRSNETVANGTSGTITDCEGNTYTGTIYTGFEDTGGYASRNDVPWYSNRSAITSVTFKDEIKPKSTAYWFADCRYMTSCDLENLNTSGTTNMSSMFNNCYKLTSLNVSDLETSNVTDMSSMFLSCSGLTSLDVSGFDTSNVTSMRYLFRNCSKLTSLDVSGFDTSNVTDMYCMFNGCSALTSLDVSNFDTSNVTTMESMFSGCSGLTSLDLSTFDTSKVESMKQMFQKCSKLASLDVSGWNTSNVTDMSYMFQYCSKLASLDLSSWNTSNVTKMYNMFSGCSSLASLDLSSFDTSKVESMSNMFSDCSSLTSLNVSNFDTSKVESMNSMFSGCSKLTSLGVSGWNTSNVTNMGSMFKGCSGLTSLDVSNFGTSKVTSMSSMFNGCSGLTSLNVSNFDTSKVTSMSSLFYNCSGLTSLDVSNFDTSKVTSMGSMFSGCSGLDSLDVSGFDTSKVTNMGSMFKGCSGLTSLNVSNFDTSNVTSMSSMFSGCSGLDSLDVSGFDTSKVTGMDEMFRGCSSLTSLDLSGFDTSNVMNMGYMFYDCDTLAKLDMSGWDTSKVTKMEYMFWYCSALKEVDLSNWDNTALSTGNAFNENTSLSKVVLGSKTNIDKLNMPDAPSDTTRYTGKWEQQGTGTALTSSEIEAQFPGTDNSLVGTWVWQRVSYPITFDKNSDDASGSMAQQTYQGDPLTLSTNTFYRLGYDFAGWNTAADGSGTSYADGATIDSLDSAMTLYAQWEEIVTTVELNNGVYTLTLKAGEKATFDNLPAGATYEVVESSAPGWTVKSQTGTSGTIESETTQQASYVNAYSPGETSASLTASKTLDDAAPADGLFAFTLQPSGDNAATEPMPTGTTGEGVDRTLTVQNAATGVSFGSMTYTAAGTYEYTITEAVPSGATDNGDGTFTEDGVTYTYDQDVETATVTVSDDGEGNLTATVAYDSDGAAFSDTTVPGSLTISKTIEGVTSSTQTFDFTVTLLKDAAALTDSYTYTVENADGTEGTGGTVTSGGTISLTGGQTATITGLPAGTAYTVTESAPGGGWSQTASSGSTGTIASNGTSAASFTNTYSASGSASIKGGKEMRGPGGSTFSADYEAGDFQFALYNIDADGNPTGDPIQTVSNGSPDADETSGAYGVSTVEFLPITYTLDDMSDATDNGDGTRSKEFTYVVEEVIPDGAVYDEDKDAYVYEGIQYDDSSQTVTVTVTDDGSGTLTTAVSDDTYSFYFTNQIEDGTAWLTKTVGTPSPASSDQTFPFTVTLSATGEYEYEIWTSDDGAAGELRGSGTISDGGATVATYDDEGNEVTLDCIYLEDGETLYIRNLPVGSTYSFEEQMPSGWTQTSSSNMSGTVTADEYESTDDSSDSTGSISTFATIADPTVPTTSEATVTNDYSASGSANFSATKTLTGATLQDSQFAFELVDSSDNVVSRVTNDASGNVDFGTISYTLADLANSDGTYDASRTFSYTVREVHGGTTLGDVTYDGTTYTAEVTVADKGDGTLSTSVSYLDSDGTAVDEVAFANTDNPKGTVALQATKDLVDDTDNNALSNWGGRTYTFTITPDDDAPLRTSATGEDLTSLTSSAASKESPTAAFSPIVYTYDDLANPDDTYAESKTFTYTISEVVPSDDDDATQDGTQQDGVTFTTETHTATVTVTNSGDGVLDTSVVYDEGETSEGTTPPIFTNTYSPTSTTGTILVTKSLSGRDWVDADSFSFTLTAGSNTAGVTTPVPDSSGQTVTVTKDSTVTTTLAGATAETTLDYTGQFGEITFSEPGSYHYTITEVIPDDASTTVGTETKTYSDLKGTDGFTASDYTWTKNGVTYDTASHSAVVKVTEDRTTGTLSAATYYYNDVDATPPTFTNTYSATAATASIEAWKTMNGLALTEGSYSIQVVDDNDSHEGMTWAGTGELTKGTVVDTGALTADNGGNGTAQLSQITFTKAGTYKFKVSEQVPNGALAYDSDSAVTKTGTDEQLTWADATETERSTYTWVLNGITYDTSTVEATVTVSDDNNGHLTSAVTYSPSVDGKTGAVFANTYDASGTATLKAAKHISGRDWTDDDSFTFVLTATGDAPLRTAAGDQESLTATATRGTETDDYAARTPSFTQLVFTHDDLAVEDDDGTVTGYVQEREFTYTIHEQCLVDGTDMNPAAGGYTKDGITYAADQTVTVKVTDNGSGALVVTYKNASGGWDNTIDAPDFINTYTTSSTTAELKATKAVGEGVPFPDGTYTFNLVSTRSTTPMPTGAVDFPTGSGKIYECPTAATQASPTVSLGTITFDEPGEYDYTITEKLPAGATDSNPVSNVEDSSGNDVAVVFDTTSHAAHVKVTDNGDGTLSATVTYDEDSTEPPTFTNVKGGDGGFSLSATKTLTGTTLLGGQFTYRLYQTGSDWDTSATDVKSLGTETNRADGSLTSYIPLSQSDLGDGETTGTFYFVAVEDNAGTTSNGMTYGAAQLRAKVEVERVASGDTYTIRPTSVTYSSSETSSTYTETYSTLSDGTWGVTGTTGTKPTFSNSYAATGTATLDASKHIDGREWRDGESFSFTLTGNDGAPVRTSATDTDSSQTLTATATSDDRIVDFPSLVFTQDDLADKDASGAVTGYSDKTFTYTIHEVVPDGATNASVDGGATTYAQATDEQKATAGWTYEGLTYAADQTVKVNVHDQGDGTLRVTYGDAGTNTPENPQFDNTYTIETGATAKLGAYKQLSGRSWLDDDSFEFILKAVSNTAVGEDGGAVETPMPIGHGVKATVTASSPTVGESSTTKSCEFGEIEFTRPGVYTYTISETVPSDTNGLTYDTATHDAVVTVTDNLDGTLSAQVTYGATQSTTPATFTNSYTTVSVASFALSATKSITGKALGAGEHAVDVYDVDPRNDQSASYLDHMTNTATGSFTSDTFTYTRAELDALVESGKADKDATDAGLDRWSMTYWLREANAGQTVGGVTNDDSVHEATVTVTDNGKGTLVSAVTYNDTSSTAPTISNAYDASGTAVVRVTKGLTGRAWLDDDSFTFKIAAGGVANADASDTATPSLTAAPLVASGTEATATKAAPTASFPELEYTLDDLANDDGTYSAKTFDYTITEVEGSIGGVTYATDSVTAHVTVRDAGDGTLTSSVTYGDQASSTVPTVTNPYAAADTTATVQANKVLEGRDWTDDDAFTFQLTAVDDAPLRTSDGASATATATSSSRMVTFPTLTYTFSDLGGVTTRTFSYTISEVTPTDDDSTTEGIQSGGITYTTEEHTAYVTLTDNGDGTMSTSVAYDDGATTPPTFTNTYAPQGTTVVLKATKTLTGRALEDGEFHIVGSYADGSQAQVFRVANVGTSFSSPELAYDVETLDELADGGEAEKVVDGSVTTWTIDYVLAEELPDDEDPNTSGVQADGVTYDESTHAATVTVTEDGSGRLSASVAYDNATGGDAATLPTFSNVYGASGTAQVAASKVLTGRDLSAGEFSFELFAGDEAQGEALQTTSNAADGSVSFSPMAYTVDDLAGAQEKTFDYAIVEVAGDEPDVTYDTSTHVAHVKVTDNGDGTLTTEVTYDDGSATVPVFENAYVPPENPSEQPPALPPKRANEGVIDTSDPTKRQGTFYLAGTGLVFLLAAFILRRRRSE